MDAKKKTTEKAFLGVVYFSRCEWRAAVCVPHLSRSWQRRSKQGACPRGEHLLVEED